MAEVTIRDLRNHGGEVIDRVQAGEPITITRDGRPVAQLVPFGPQPISAEALLARWRRLLQASGDIDGVSCRQSLLGSGDDFARVDADAHLD